MQKIKDDIEIRELGIKSLVDTLGYAGTIRFFKTVYQRKG